LPRVFNAFNSSTEGFEAGHISFVTRVQGECKKRMIG
jgi:hypothetical protein